MLFGQRSQKRQEPIKVLIGEPAELLGDEFALVHILSISFYGSNGAPGQHLELSETSCGPCSRTRLFSVSCDYL